MQNDARFLIEKGKQLCALGGVNLFTFIAAQSVKRRALGGRPRGSVRPVDWVGRPREHA